MSRASRSRSKRTRKESSGSGFRVPVLPAIIGLGVVVVVALVGYLIVQSGGSSASNEEWAEVEADPAPDLPGEFVDLQTIYDGTYGEHGNNATATHVQVDVDYEADGNSSPPAGGPHWGSGSCPDDPDSAPQYCGPAPWGIYREPWRAEVLVHNEEHGGVVVWYHTDDTAIIEELEDLVLGRLQDGDVIVMAPYEDMEEDHIALTSWARIDKFPVAEYTSERVDDYLNTHVRRFNPEGF
jgi:hypothetical protein